MKNRKYQLLAFTAVILTACSPSEPDQRTGGAPDGLSAGQVSIIKEISGESANKIAFTVQVDAKVPYSVFWDLGNETTAKGEKAEGIYPQKGDYTVQVMIYTADGKCMTIQELIRLEEDDYSLISSPAYLMLTGGTDNPEGRTWVFDRGNRYASEVSAVTGKPVNGHIGLGEANGGYQGWWSAGADDKAGGLNHHYEFRLTFKLDGMELHVATDGKGNGRSVCTSSWPGYVAIDGDEGEFDYQGGKYSFSLNEEGETPMLTVSEGAVLGYYVCNDTYEIIYQTDEVLALRTQQADTFDWVFVFIREDLLSQE
jgi:hypothetical protein